MAHSGVLAAAQRRVDVRRGGLNLLGYPHRRAAALHDALRRARLPAQRAIQPRQCAPGQLAAVAVGLAQRRGRRIAGRGQGVARPLQLDQTVLQKKQQTRRTLWRRYADVLAYFDHHTSNGPTKPSTARLEALRRNALGFSDLTHYRIRSLLHCGNLARQIDAL